MTVFMQNMNKDLNITMSLCFQRFLFFKLQLKKTISDCRKYRFFLGHFLSSLSNMYSCQRTGYVQGTEVVKSATATGDLQRHSCDKKNNKIKSMW